MKTLELIFIFGLGIIGFTVAQSNCPGPDYSVILKLIASLNATIRPVKAVGYPEQLPLNNSRYADFWYWNYIGQEYADTINNITSFILQGISLFSSSVNNTKGDWNSLVANISQLITTISSSTGSFSIPMTYAAIMFKNFGLSMGAFFFNFQELLQSYFTMLPLLNVNATPANVLKLLPSPIIMEAFLKQMSNATNQWIALVNSTSKDINNTYSLFKQADPYFLAIDTQYNATIYNMSLATNKSMIFMNQTIFNFTKSANTTYNNFMNSLPAPLKTSSAWQDSWATANASRDEFMAILETMATDLSSYLLDYLSNNQMALYMFYTETIVSQMSYIRQMLFTLFTMNVSYNQCYSKFFNQTTAAFNASGGALALFNCTNLESTVLTELQTILVTYFNTLSLDVNNSLAYIQRCTNLTSTPILAGSPTSTGYSMQQCLEAIGTMVLQGLSTSTGMQQIFDMIATELALSSQTIETCISSKVDSLMALFTPFYVAYSNCTAALSPEVGGF